MERLFVKYKSCVYLPPVITEQAAVMELVDMLDLGSSAARRGGSTPFSRTSKPYCKSQ